MNEGLLRAILKVLLDGQAYMYASVLQTRAEALGQPSGQKEFEQWQADWKKETVELLQSMGHMEGFQLEPKQIEDEEIKIGSTE